MNLFFDLTKNAPQLSKLISSNSTGNTTRSSESTATNNANGNGSIILKAPQLNQVLFFNEPELSSSPSPPTLSPMAYYQQDMLLRNSPSIKSALNTSSSSSSASKQNGTKSKKKVTFPEDGKIIKDYSEPPKRGWTPGLHSTSDLFPAYLRSCERHKCKPLNKLLPQLKALQDLDCANGEKVNVLNLKSKHIRQNGFNGCFFFKVQLKKNNLPSRLLIFSLKYLKYRKFENFFFKTIYLLNDQPSARHYLYKSSIH